MTYPGRRCTPEQPSYGHRNSLSRYVFLTVRSTKFSTQTSPSAVFFPCFLSYPSVPCYNECLSSYWNFHSSALSFVLSFLESVLLVTIISYRTNPYSDFVVIETLALSNRKIISRSRCFFEIQNKQIIKQNQHKH